MIINTHKILSAVIYDKVQENTNFQLAYKYFLWGNIQPDITPGLVLKSHYKSDSLDFVINKIIKLSNIPAVAFENKQIINHFSKDIGIVSHFLCDFFCYPHYKHWHYNSPMMLPHLKFEKGLNSKARNIQTIPSLSLPEIEGFEANTLESFIETVLDDYSFKEDYLNDLTYASNICTKTIETIFNLIFNKENARAYSQIA